MNRIYRYVLANDGGMAPHPKRGLITLATCKPEIRRMAREGDWVLGNYPSPANEVVAWAGSVGRCLPIHDYSRHYPSRDDALYELAPDGKLRRIGGKHTWYHRGESERRKDVKGKVLVFDRDKSWYFGGNGRVLPSALFHLAASGQGHRVNLRQPGDLALLEEWLTEQGPPGIHGEPRDDWTGPAGSGCEPRGPKPPKKKAGC